MTSKAKFVPLIAVLALLMSLIAIIPAFAAVRGTVKILNPADLTKELSWARQGGTVTLEIRDADLDVASDVADETATYGSACNTSIGDTRLVQVTTVPIVDRNSDGVVNFLDVILGAGANAETSVFSVDGLNGIVTLKCETDTGTATTQVLTYKAATVDTVGTAVLATTTVKVTSNADAAGIGVILTETGSQTGIFRKTITLTSADSVADTSLKVGKSDVVKLSYTDSAPTPTTTVTDAVNVESTDPTLANFSPAHGFGTQSSRPTVSADVTDADSLVKKTTVKVVFARDTDSPFDDVINDAEEVVVSDFGTLTAITSGWHAEQRLPATLAPSNDAQIFWWVVGDDNAGNKGVSDRQPTISGATDTCDPSAFPAVGSLAGKDVTVTGDIAGCQPFTVKVDFTAPDMQSASTGWFWDTTKTTTDKTETSATKAKKTSVAADFNESIDGTTVQASDFTVDGVAPVAAEHFSGKSNRVFLTVSTLAANAKPKVKLVGEVKDIAGNPLTIDEVTAADGIAPTITVTVTGTGASVPITKNKVTIQFSTDEDATVDINSVAVSPMKTATSLDTALTAVSPTLVSARTWKVDYTPGTAGVFNVYVKASDLAGNEGTKGHETDPSSTKAILFEKDTAVGAPTFTPATQTDDPNTFVIIDYAAEGKEYGLDAGGDFTIVAGDVATSKDTHKKVTLTSATLDGESILADIVTEDDVIFLYKASDLSLAEHTLKVKATDDAGTTSSEISHKFKVVAKALFEVKLRPGWNLVSLPNEPADPAINSVISSALPIDQVLTYDPTATGSPWLTADRDPDTGNLVGTLTQMTAGRGYWVHTTTFQPIKVDIPGTAGGAFAVPPTVSLQIGWNLIPVLDVTGTKKAGDALTIDAAAYLKNLTFSRIYEFDTLANQYKIVESTDFLKVGSGYWVYVTKVGTLVP